jgi:hypothetical protein
MFLVSRFWFLVYSFSLGCRFNGLHAGKNIYQSETRNQKRETRNLTYLTVLLVFPVTLKGCASVLKTIFLRLMVYSVAKSR